MISSCTLAGDAVGGHAAAQLAFQILHARHGAAHADGAAQLFGFAAGEVGDDHRHADELLLKERNAEGALEHGLQQRMRVRDRLPCRAAASYKGSSCCPRWGRGG